MLKTYGLPIISITINMPGPIKDLKISRCLCDYAVDRIKAAFSITEARVRYLTTGPEAILAVDADPDAIKAAAMAIEEGQAFGRLLDIDVFTADGILVSRRQQGKSRRCLVCGGETVLCMREKSHSPEDLARAVTLLLVNFSAYVTRDVSPVAEKIGAAAVEAMLYEVTCTPAPGLVDRDNSGAHDDMDFYSFMSSSAALSLAMARTAQAGLNHDAAPVELLPVLRVIGLEGEQAMLDATRGVNTQKGLLFSLGIACAAAGYLYRQGQPVTAAAVLGMIRKITHGIVERELGRAAEKTEDLLTAGERLYRDYGITGIRGEMEQGLPAVHKEALPALRKALAEGLHVNDALVHTLLVLMLYVDDTTVMHRHDPHKMRHWVRERARAALDAGGMATEQGRRLITLLDEEFIAHNVSPGGAADLLAVTWFLHRLEGLIEMA